MRRKVGRKILEEWGVLVFHHNFTAKRLVGGICNRKKITYLLDVDIPLLWFVVDRLSVKEKKWVLGCICPSNLSQQLIMYACGLHRTEDMVLSDGKCCLIGIHPCSHPCSPVVSRYGHTLWTIAQERPFILMIPLPHRVAYPSEWLKSDLDTLISCGIVNCA